MAKAELAQPVETQKEKKEYGKYDKWEVENWARTLKEAELIKQDPEKVKFAKMCMSKEAEATEKAISSLDDLKALRKSKMEAPEEPDEYTEDDSE